MQNSLPNKWLTDHVEIRTDNLNISCINCDNVYRKILDIVVYVDNWINTAVSILICMSFLTKCY
jgi:hypothetical protein